MNKMGLTRINFEVDPLEKQTCIKYIRVGSDPTFAMIVVRQSKHSDFVLYWDLEKNVEIVSFEHKSDPIIFFDAKETLILQKTTRLLSVSRTLDSWHTMSKWLTLKIKGNSSATTMDTGLTMSITIDPFQRVLESFLLIHDTGDKRQ